jgi:hypothetical protein
MAKRKSTRAATGGEAAARAALVAERPRVARWVVSCTACGRQGHRPGMPGEIDRRGTAARVRALFPPLALCNRLCEGCTWASVGEGGVPPPSRPVGERGEARTKHDRPRGDDPGGGLALGRGAGKSG